MRSNIQELDIKMDALEIATKSTEKKIVHLTSAEATAADPDDPASLSKILKQDTDLREARGQLLVIDSTLNSMIALVKSAQKDLAMLKDSPEASNMSESEMLDVIELAPVCDQFMVRLKDMEQRLTSSYEHCRRFDRVVGKRWNGITQGGGDTSKIMEQFSLAMKKFETMLAEKPDMDEIQAYATDLVGSAVANVESKMNHALFKLRMRNVEQTIRSGMSTNSGVGDENAGSKDDREFEMLLEPLIRDVVEMYVGGAQMDGGEYFSRNFNGSTMDLDSFPEGFGSKSQRENGEVVEAKDGRESREARFDSDKSEREIREPRDSVTGRGSRASSRTGSREVMEAKEVLEGGRPPSSAGGSRAQSAAENSYYQGDEDEDTLAGLERVGPSRRTPFGDVRAPGSAGLEAKNANADGSDGKTSLAILLVRDCSSDGDHCVREKTIAATCAWKPYLFSEENAEANLSNY